MMTPTAEVIREAGTDRAIGRWPVRFAERRAARRIARATRGRGLWTAKHARKVRGRILSYIGKRRPPVGDRLAVVSFVVGRFLARYSGDVTGPVDAATAEALSAYAELLRQVAGRRFWHRPILGGPGARLYLVEEVHEIHRRGHERARVAPAGPAGIALPAQREGEHGQRAPVATRRDVPAPRESPGAEPVARPSTEPPLRTDS